MEPCIAYSKEAMFRLRVFRGNGAKKSKDRKRVRDEQDVKKKRTIVTLPPY